MFILTIKGDIASAHLLRGYEGKCSQLHGHTWKIEVQLMADALNHLGMVEDFSILKKKFRTYLQHLDHTNLNELEYFQEVNPTAENIAKYIYQTFKKEVEPLTLKHVQVWESDIASAIYYE